MNPILDLRLHAPDPSRVALQLTYTPADATATSDLLAAPLTLALDPAHLPAPALDPVAYGHALTAALLPAPAAAAFARARALAQPHPLRLRLHLPPALAPLVWETLRDPDFGNPLFTAEQVCASRFSSSPDTRPIPRRPAEQLRVLVAIANPANLSDYTPNGQPLAPFAPEAALAQQSLAAAQVTYLDAPGAVQLATLVQHLRDDYDVLYLMAHGQLVRGEPYLWLVQDNGNAAVTAASDLITALRDLPRPIPFVVLASCASAGAVTALAPQFAAAGAPAVLGMQGQVALETLAQFLPVLFAELRRDGQIDRAVAAARNAIRQRNDWWMPVLYLRLHDGRLWAADDPAAPTSATISGTATVGGDNSGVNVGVNAGTISQTTQSIHNHAPNQGAQGTFNAPLTFNQPTTGSVAITGSDFSGSRNVRITGTQVGTPPHPAADPDHAPDPPDRV